MNHPFPFLRLVFVGIGNFACVITNMDRQMDQSFNMLSYFCPTFSVYNIDVLEVDFGDQFETRFE